jgi:hypothetical protein
MADHAKSFQTFLAIPSAILSDGIITVPLWAVTAMTLSESYHLPPIGSTGIRAVIGTHDDTMTLSGVLVGPTRSAWKLGLETLAESGKRGSFLARRTGGKLGGLILVTALTIRTDIQIQSLSFSISAAKRDALDVSISLAHLPLPSAQSKLLVYGSAAVAALGDWLM